MILLLPLTVIAFAIAGVLFWKYRQARQEMREAVSDLMRALAGMDRQMTQERGQAASVFGTQVQEAYRLRKEQEERYEAERAEHKAEIARLRKKAELLAEHDWKDVGISVVHDKGERRLFHCSCGALMPGVQDAGEV